MVSICGLYDIMLLNQPQESESRSEDDVLSVYFAEQLTVLLVYDACQQSTMNVASDMRRQPT